MIYILCYVFLNAISFHDVIDPGSPHFPFFNICKLTGFHVKDRIISGFLLYNFEFRVVFLPSRMRPKVRKPIQARDAKHRCRVENRRIRAFSKINCEKVNTDKRLSKILTSTRWHRFPYQYVLHETYMLRIIPWHVSDKWATTNPYILYTRKHWNVLNFSKVSFWNLKWENTQYIWHKLQSVTTQRSRASWM